MSQDDLDPKSFARMEACVRTLLEVLNLHDPSGVLRLRMLVKTMLRLTPDHIERDRLEALLREIGTIVKECEHLYSDDPKEPG